MVVPHRNIDELERGMAVVLQAPKDRGVLLLIARRPDSGQRELVETAELDVDEGLVGDNWKARGSKATPDGSAHPELQLTLMNARTIELVAGARENWALAGDQLYVDFDLSSTNLPPGTTLSIGTALVVFSVLLFSGCCLFLVCFGVVALW